MNIREMRESAEKLMKYGDLSYCPIGIKFVDKEDKIPKNAIRPFRNTKNKWAVCQLIQKARREHSIYAMTIEDHWCWYPMISYGHVKLEKGNYDYEVTINNVGIPDKQKEIDFVDKIPHLDHQSIYATLIGSLDVIDYIPDVILIYCDNAQVLRRLVGCVKYMDGDMLSTELDYVNSCCWSIIPTFKNRQFRVTIPDPGEFQRAEIGENEMILSVPPERYAELCEVNETKEKRFANRQGMFCGLVPYFPRPEFIDNLYKYWGLEHGRDISWTEDQRGYANNKFDK